MVRIFGENHRLFLSTKDDGLLLFRFYNRKTKTLEYVFAVKLKTPWMKHAQAIEDLLQEVKQHLEQQEEV